MRKEEIRYDPVKDKIIRTIEYLKNNQSLVLKAFLGLIVIVAIASYYSNLNFIKNETASNVAGIAQSAFLKGNVDEALVKFERVLSDYPNTKAAHQSLVYLLNDAITDGDYAAISTVLSKIDGEIDKISDPVIKSSIYKVQGDIALKDGNIDQAISFYKDAESSADIISNQLRYKIDISLAFLAEDDYNSAMRVLEEVVDSDDIGYNEKNKAEELLAYIKQKLNI